jgi:N-acyl-D-amino-acid deacylase
VGHDLVIVGGSVVDGTGAPAVHADIAIDGDRITEIGTVDRTGAKRIIDADGRTVTPGFVDLHTHLDAQFGWDRWGTSSCWHGVTSVVMGNCGVTFAPVRPGDHQTLAALMESVEDIPAAAILGGLPWTWESYGEYLDALESDPIGLNVGGFVGHGALRTYAMGDHGADEDAVPSADELALMVRLADDAIAHGALGVSTSRTLRHRTPDGRAVPGTFADPEELRALAAVLARHGRGVLECAPRFDGDGPAEPRVESELAWMAAISRELQIPLTFNLTQSHAQGTHYRRALELSAAANANGARIRPQTTPRHIGLLFSLGSMTPFDGLERWEEMHDWSFDDKLTELKDPTAWAGFTEEFRTSLLAGNDYTDYFVMFPDRDARYDMQKADSLGAYAASRSLTAIEAFINIMNATDGKAIVSWPILNQDLDAVAEMLRDPNVLIGLADSGAHVGQTMDASQPTFFLSYWMRERGAFGLEDAVRRITSDTASFVGLPDRGVLRPGAFGDLNVIDLDALALPVPEYVHDLPNDAGRFVQRARGIDHTIVNGVPFMDHGEATGELPGRILRGT